MNLKKINPQKESGYTPIAHTVLEALCKINIPSRVRRVVDAVIRKTWGYGKKEDWISLGQISHLTELSRSDVCKAMKQAVDMKLIIKKVLSAGHMSNTRVIYRFNKFYSQWVLAPRTTVGQKGNRCWTERKSGVGQKGNLVLDTCATTIDNIQKTIYNIKDTKDIIRGGTKVKGYLIYDNVKLTERELIKLFERYGKEILKKMLLKLDSYIDNSENGKQYTNHYKAIVNGWVARQILSEYNLPKGYDVRESKKSEQQRIMEQSRQDKQLRSNKLPQKHIKIIKDMENHEREAFLKMSSKEQVKYLKGKENEL